MKGFCVVALLVLCAVSASAIELRSNAMSSALLQGSEGTVCAVGSTKMRCPHENGECCPNSAFCCDSGTGYTCALTDDGKAVCRAQTSRGPRVVARVAEGSTFSIRPGVKEVTIRPTIHIKEINGYNDFNKETDLSEAQQKEETKDKDESGDGEDETSGVKTDNNDEAVSAEEEKSEEQSAAENSAAAPTSPDSSEETTEDASSSTSNTNSTNGNDETNEVAKSGDEQKKDCDKCQGHTTIINNKNIFKHNDKDEAPRDKGSEESSEEGSEEGSEENSEESSQEGSEEASEGSEEASEESSEESSENAEEDSENASEGSGDGSEQSSFFF